MFLIAFFISQFYIHFFDIYEFHFSITDGFLTLFSFIRTDTTISKEAEANGRT